MNLLADAVCAGMPDHAAELPIEKRGTEGAERDGVVVGYDREHTNKDQFL
jgi:hypothetical protein